MIKLSKGWLNLGQITWADDLGNSIMVYSAGQSREYRGADVATIRSAMNYEADEFAAVMERTKAEYAKDCEFRLRERRVVSSSFGEQEDGTLIAR